VSTDPQGGADPLGLLDRQELLDRFAADAAAVTRRLAAGVELDAPVRWCPGWTARDLVAHVGTIHRWAARVVTTGEAIDEDEPPRLADAELAGWFDAGAAVLLDTLQSTDPGTPCWGLGPPPRRAGFWVRRQAHETAMHRWDLEDALGAAAPLGEAFAADAVDEVRTVFFPRQVRLGRIAPLDRSVLMVLADGRGWTFAGDGTAAPGDEPEPDAVVTASAEVLARLLWHRADLAEATSVTGDAAAARQVLGTALTP
jgi:uncharacterized protein (TIGR03083 family)